MKLRHQATRQAIELIKRFEGFRRRAAMLQDGAWTIGYGHTRTARAGAAITEADADALLIYDVASVITAVNEWVYSPLTQNQFDALVAFAFNIGLTNFRRSSVLRRLNEGQHLQAACAMEMWRTADFEGERIVIDALVRRRSAEMALFLTPAEGHIPVPSLIVMPRVDDEAARAVPLQSAAVKTTLEDQLAKIYRDDEAMPSAGLAALEAVSQRLNALLQDDEPIATAPLPQVVEAAPATPAAAPAAAATAAPRVMEAPAEAAAPSDEVNPIAFSMLSASLAKTRKKRMSPPEPVLAMVGLIGLGVFAAGLFWGFNAKAAERLPIPVDPLTTGWVLGLVGMALAASSIYFLLNRLGSSAD